ncbi:MAG: SRPBCC domain-containing protein [Geminicoccaceae bacterium]
MPATATRPSLTIERHVKAPRETVFAAWTDPQKLSRWFGPARVSVLEAEVAAFAGGRYRIVMLDTDGARHEVGGIFREVVAPEKLVFTWAWKSMPERESVVTLRLAEVLGGTRLTLVHEAFADEATRGRHQNGWTGSLDKLDAYLSA